TRANLYKKASNSLTLGNGLVKQPKGGKHFLSPDGTFLSASIRRRECRPATLQTKNKNSRALAREFSFHRLLPGDRRQGRITSPGCITPTCATRTECSHADPWRSRRLQPGWPGLANPC